MTEVEDGDERCLPSDATSIEIQAHTYTDEELKVRPMELEPAQSFEDKTWHFSFILTGLAIAATYVTIIELREVGQNLEQRVQVGQRENYGSKLSLFSNCIICMWHMSYSLIFCIASLLFNVLHLNISLQNWFVYFAVPAFWFFMLSFVFLSRLIILQWRIQNYDSMSVPSQY